MLQSSKQPLHDRSDDDVGESTLPGDLEPMHGVEATSMAGTESIWIGHTDSDTAHAPERVVALPTVGHIGRYQLKYHLGKGGIGTVWAAYDPLLSRLIAIKTVPLDLPQQDLRRINPQFLGEARAAANMSHKHIVTVFDAGLSPEGAYIAMELLNGKDLAQMLRLGWRPTPVESALIVRRIADALAYAHSRGVIHRDIKPGNIFMVGPSKPLVLDFGTASVAHRSEVGEPVFGSPYYASPEQIQGLSTDPRTDVYSLGITFYELLGGEKPFTGRSLDDIIASVVHGHPRPLQTIDPNLPHDLIAIVQKAMARHPEQRHESAAMLSKEIRHWLSSHPVETEAQADKSSKKTAFSARNYLSLAAMAGLGAAVAAAVMALMQRH
ncbi:MAG: serine/threonine-protein kinase [Leptothrix ochracea]